MKPLQHSKGQLCFITCLLVVNLLIFSSWESTRAGKSFSQNSPSKKYDAIGANRMDGIPTTWSLGKNFPDPFCSRDISTCIPFGLIQHADIHLSILDYETNDTLRTLIDGPHSAGLHTVCWDGRDSTGSLVPSGFYVYRLTVAVDGSVVFDSSGVATQCCGDDCFFSEVATPLISFPSTTLGDTTVATLILRNPLNHAITLKALSSAGEGIFLSSDFEESLLHGIAIEPDSSVSGDAYFCPLKEGIYKRNVFFESFDTGDTLALTHLRGRGRAISFEWTTAGLYPDRIIDINDTLIVQETMNDSVEVDSLVLHYAVGGSAMYQKVKMNLTLRDPINDRYLAMLPAKAGGSRGLNFYVAAHNGPVVVCSPPSESPERIRIRVDNFTFPRATPAMEYEMISFPIDIPNNTVIGVLDDDLGGRNAAEWRMFAYVTSESTYAEIPNESAYRLIQGAGYWLITKDAATLDTAPLQAVSTPLDSSFVINVEPGWNMIGNPFDFPAAWDSIMVDTLPIAMCADLIESPVGWIAGQGYQYDVKTLEPFIGYWVNNLDTLSHVLRIPPEEAPTAGQENVGNALAEPPVEEREQGWKVEISAGAAKALDPSNFIGIIEDAEYQWDRYDRSEPPLSPGQAISLYFPHATWQRRSGIYSSDMRDEHEDLKAGSAGLLLSEGECSGHMWRFDVAKNYSDEAAGDEVTIAFRGLENVPADAFAYLIDLHLQRLIDVRTESPYRFFLCRRGFVSNEEDARFALLIGDGDFIESHADELPKNPAITLLRQNYPNPFNPSTIIRCDIAEAGTMELMIYDVRGSLVRTLYRGHLKPGRYEMAWRGDNDNGLKVASGIYFCRLRTELLMQTKKLILLR